MQVEREIMDTKLSKIDDSIIIKKWTEKLI
jgi:hypothetical protein